MDYNRGILKEFKQFEADIELARRYEEKAQEYFGEIDENMKLDEILDFDDNIRSVCLRIELDNCEQIKEEIRSLNQWREDYQEMFSEKANQSLTEPPLPQARALLKRANQLKVSITFLFVFIYYCSPNFSCQVYVMTYLH